MLHAVNPNLVHENRVSGSKLCLFRKHISLFISHECDQVRDFDVEMFNLFCGTENLEVTVHCEASCGCCSWTGAYVLSSVLKLARKVYSTT